MSTWRTPAFWLRLSTLVLLTSLAGLSFGGAFPARDLLLPVAGSSLLAVGVLAVLGDRAARHGRLTRTLAVVGAAAIGFSTTFVATTGTVDLGRLREGVLDGWAQLLTANPPVDVHGVAVAVPLLTVWVVALLGTRQAAAGRNPVLVALPALVGMVVGSSFGTTDPTTAFGRRTVALVPLALLASLVAGRIRTAPAPRAAWRDTARGAARTLGPAAVFVVLATMAGVVIGPHLPGAGVRPPVVLRDHYRRPQVTHPLLNPMALLAVSERRRALAIASDTTPAAVFRVDASEGVEHYPLAVLDRYDGQEWVSSATYAAAGRELTPADRNAPGDPGASGATVTQDITIEGDIGSFWLPTAGTPVTVDTPVLFDPVSATIATDHPAVGLHYAVVSHVSSFSPEQLQGAHIAAGAAAAPYLSVPDGVPDTLRSLAQRAMTGSTFQLQQVFALQEYLKTHYQRRPPAQAQPGHSLPQLNTFLTDPQQSQGSPEQFAAAFALLARLAGIPTRLVIGYRGDGVAGTQEVTSADLTVWPEVRFAELGWLPFDPIPNDVGAAADTDIAAAARPGTNEAIAQAAAPATADGSTGATAEELAATGAGRAGPAVGLPALLALLVVLAVLAAARPAVRRRRRRHRRRTRPAPRARVMGAWDEALDRLVESGHDRRRADALTAPEVVACGTAIAGDDAEPALRALAALANAAWYGDGELSEEDALAAWASEEEFERRWSAQRTWRQRLRPGRPRPVDPLPRPALVST